MYFADKKKKTGYYFAFQIVESEKCKINYLLLDYFDARKPEINDLPTMQAATNNRWFYKDGSIIYDYAEAKYFPKDAELEGNILPKIEAKCKCYSSWPTGQTLVAEKEWLQIPEEARKRFKEGQLDTSEILVAGITCRRSFQRVGDELLSAMSDYQKELYELPVACNFVATQYYPQLIPFLATRHTASKLEWRNHEQKTLDLSATHLREIIISEEKMQDLILPYTCEKIGFSGLIHPNLKIQLIDNNQDLIINIDVAAQGNVIPNLGVKCLSGLILQNVEDVDLDVIANYYPNLKWLFIAGKPGNVKNIQSLGRLSKLEGLSMDDIFGFTSQEFPICQSFPKLESLWLESIPEEAGKAIKKLYKGKVHELDVLKLRKPEWLAENLDNPLRHWDGSEFVTPSQAKKSFAIYRDCRRAVMSSVQEYLETQDNTKLNASLIEIAKSYILAFNKIDARTNFIETDEREDILCAFDKILSDTGALKSMINISELEDVMDELREW